MVKKLIANVTPQFLLQLLITIFVAGVAWATIKGDIRLINQRDNQQDKIINELVKNREETTKLLWKIAGKLNIKE